VPCDGTLTADSSAIVNGECELFWVGGFISIVNYGNADCTWVVTESVEGLRRIK
jgi:hypothetical protein